MCCMHLLICQVSMVNVIVVLVSLAPVQHSWLHMLRSAIAIAIAIATAIAIAIDVAVAIAVAIAIGIASASAITPDAWHHDGA